MIKIFILLGLFSVAFGVYPQFAMLYQENNCFGQNYQYTFDTKESLTEPWSNALSVKFRGAWVMVQDRISSPGQVFLLIADGDASICLMPDSDFTVSSVTKLLDVDLETSAISLIPNVEDLTTVMNIYGPEHRFDVPRTFETVVITGIVDYTLFEGVNFNGTSFCAEADHYNSDDYFGAINVYNPTGSFTVGSLRLGNCRERKNKITKPEQIKNNMQQEERRIFKTDSGMKISVPAYRDRDNIPIFTKTT